MLFAFGGLIGLLAGLAAGGSVRNLAHLRLVQPWVPVAALIVKDLGLYTSVSGTWVPLVLYPASQVLLAAWCALHASRLRGAALVAVGIALNVLAIALNGGRMPVARALAGQGPQELLATGHYAQYVLAGPGTRLAWLGDWIAFPAPISRIFPQAYSIGDLVSFVGMVAVLFLAVRRRPSEPITTR